MAKIDTANIYLRKALKSYTNFVYGKKLRELKKSAPDLFKPRNPEKEQEHLRLWKKLDPKVNIGWFRFFANLSGIDDPNYVPDNIYHAIIEKNLNDINYAWVFADKNFYQRNFGEKYFPKTYLRNVAGSFLDRDYSLISEKTAKSLFEGIKSDMIIKPSIDSNSGLNVIKLKYVNNHYFMGSKSVNWDFILSMYRKNYLIQEVAFQHDRLAVLNQSSVNTLRVFTYRSVSDDTIFIKSIILRIGRAGQSVDNGHMGGLICGIDTNGNLSPKSSTVEGVTCESNPDHGYLFKNKQIPCLESVKKTCCKVADMVYPSRNLSFDITIKEDSKPLIIEINTFGQGAHASQFFTSGLFGNHTNEVINYCLSTPNSDHFKILRLFG